MIYYFFFFIFISLLPKLVVILLSNIESTPICYWEKLRLFLFFLVSNDPFLLQAAIFYNIYCFYTFLSFYVDLIRAVPF